MQVLLFLWLPEGEGEVALASCLLLSPNPSHPPLPFLLGFGEGTEVGEGEGAAPILDKAPAGLTPILRAQGEGSWREKLGAWGAVPPFPVNQATS